MKNWLTITFVLLLSVGALFFWTGEKNPSRNDNEIVFYNDDHFYGDRNAAVKIIEYAEVECEYCKRLHPTLLRIVDEHPGKVALVYRHFPLPLHPKSFTEALALECVSELSGNESFWLYLFELYRATPSNNQIDLAILPDIAQRIGVNQEHFNECMELGTHRERVQRDIESGFAFGVDSVPQLRVTAENGETLVFTKSPSYTALTSAVEALLGI